MSREAFIEKIISHLLTQVDPEVLTLMASEGREDLSGVSGFASLGGGQNLRDSQVTLLVMLNDAQQAKLRDTFANRYRRMIREFIELKEKLLFHQNIPDEEFEAEIINYVNRSDQALGRSVYQIANNRSVQSVTKRASRPSSVFDTQKMAESSDRLAIQSLKRNVTLSSTDCNRRFADVKTSEKGLVQLLGAGELQFVASDIEEILACHKADQRNDFAFIFDTMKLFSGESLPDKPIYTAIRLSGRYSGMYFVEVDFDYSYPKLTKAMKISNAIKKRKYGDFK